MFASKSFIVFLAFSLVTISTINANCEDAYTSASYGLSHSKKAFKANNFDHQKYYAGRALEALEKTRGIVEQCGCQAALDAIELGIESLEEALDPEDWEMGRYFTKRAMEYNYSILDNLDVCSMEDSNSETSSDDSVEEAGSTVVYKENSPNKEEAEALMAFEASAQKQLQELQEKVAGLHLLLDGEQVAPLKTAASPKASHTSMEEAKAYYKAQSLTLYKQAIKAFEEYNPEEQ